MTVSIMARIGSFLTGGSMASGSRWSGRNAIARAGSLRCDACMSGRSYMSDWIDPDDAPELTAEIAARGELRVGGRLIRPATGTLTKAGRPPLRDKPKRQ